MQQLDQQSLLRLARCSRALFRCASHPFVWQCLPATVEIRGSKVIEDPHRARSLLRFAPSAALIDLSESESDSILASCETLLSVPRLISLQFLIEQPLMQLDEWRLFLQHPNAKRLTYVDIDMQLDLCDGASVSLLSQLPLLNTLYLAIPLVQSPSYFEPLANAPSLTELDLWAPADFNPQLVSLEPLARCTRLRLLSLNELSLHVGQLSELLMELARAGGQLEELQLTNLLLLPMDDVAHFAAPDPREALSFELIFAASSLSHLRTLEVIDCEMVLDFLPCIPSLRVLNLKLTLLPSAATLALLLRRLPDLRINIKSLAILDPPLAPDWQEHNEDTLPQLQQLAQQYSRLVIQEAPAPAVVPPVVAEEAPPAPEPEEQGAEGEALAAAE
jgi:hypothetical protein